MRWVEEEGGEGSAVEGTEGAGAEGLPPRDTARGAGLRVVCWPDLSLALGSESSWAWKQPQGPSSHVVATQKRFRGQLSHISPRQPGFWLCPGEAGLAPSPLHPYPSAPGSNSSSFPQPFLSLGSGFQPLPCAQESPPGQPPRLPPCRAGLRPHVIQLLSYPCPAYHAISVEGQRLRVYCAEPCLLTTLPPNPELRKGRG